MGPKLLPAWRGRSPIALPRREPVTRAGKATRPCAMPSSVTLSGRSDHNIAITRPDPRGPVSTDALLEAYRRYQDTRRGSFPSYHGLPEEDLARIAAAMDEQELRITPEEMESEDFMALDRRLD